jgi:phage gpG-like protein
MIELKLEGTFEKLIRRFEKLRDSLETEEILDEAGALLLNRIRTSFLAEKDPDDVFWIPSAAAIRRRAQGGSGTLFDTGRLFRSIQLGTRGVGERVIATDVPYAKAHQFGVPGKLPIRLFLGFGESDEALVQRLLEKRFERLLRE